MNALFIGWGAVVRPRLPGRVGPRRDPPGPLALVAGRIGAVAVGGRFAVRRRRRKLQALGGLLLRAWRVRPGCGGSVIAFRLVGCGVGAWWRVVGLTGGHVDVLLDLHCLVRCADATAGPLKRR